MTCPACGGALTPVDVPGLTVDVCRDGCAGIWFDRSELRSVDEPAENAGEALVGLAGTPRVIVDATGRRRCPRCPDSVLMRHFYSAKRAVAVDECPTCAGTWLDGGELAEIRAEYASGGDRRQVVQLLAEEILANDRMALMRKQLDEELPFYDASRSRIVASLLVVVYVGAAFMVAGSAATASVAVLPIALSTTGAVLIVKTIEVTAHGSVVLLERASDGARASVEIAGSGLAASALTAGTVVTVSVIGAGVVLSSAAEAIAFIPNALGKALLYNERLTY